MNWVEKNGNHFSSPYRVYRTSQGQFEAWYYGKTHYVIARGFITAIKAKECCEKHKAKPA